MKKELPAAKLPLPKFASDKEAAEYFETHSVADVWNRLAASKPAKPSKALARSIEERMQRKIAHLDSAKAAS